MKNKPRYEKSSGNVFHDLGLGQPEREQLKAQLALEIHSIIDGRGWTQQQAAEVLGISQPEVSKLLKGDYPRFRIDRLFLFLNRLDRKVEIRIKKPRKGETAHTVLAS